MAASDCIPEIRDIPGYPGYGASEDGRVWSRWERKGKCRRGAGWVLVERWHERKQTKKPSRRFVVKLRREGRGCYLHVHTLVLLAFIGPRPKGLECRHLNGDPTDNRLVNLRWGTRSENEADKARHGTVPQGERAGNSVLSVGKVRQIRRWAAAGQTQREIACRLGVHRATVGDVVTGRRWGHVR
jgi:hypothetical protein